MSDDQAIRTRAKRLGMFTPEEVVVLVSKIMYDAHQFNKNYFELNLREKAEFEAKWMDENIFKNDEQKSLFEWANSKMTDFLSILDEYPEVSERIESIM